MEDVSGRLWELFCCDLTRVEFHVVGMLVSSAGILHVPEEFSATQSGAAVEVILTLF